MIVDEDVSDEAEFEEKIAGLEHCVSQLSVRVEDLGSCNKSSGPRYPMSCSMASETRSVLSYIDCNTFITSRKTCRRRCLIECWDLVDDSLTSSICKTSNSDAVGTLIAENC